MKSLGWIWIFILLHSITCSLPSKRPSKHTHAVIPTQPDVVSSKQQKSTDLFTYVSIQALMLSYYGSLGCALPFIPIYYRYLGLSDHTIGLLGSITPAITFIVSPLWGAFADYTGQHKQIMIITFIFSFLIRYAFIYKSKNVFIISSIIIFSAIFNAPVKPLMDSAVLDLLTNKNDYGKSRFFGQVGFGLGSYMVGPIVHSSSTIHKIFYAHLGISIPTVFLMLKFNPIQKIKSEENSKASFFHIITTSLRKSDVPLFFLIVFFIGVSSGIIENFAYVRMSEIAGKHKNVLGLSRLLSSLAGGPMFWLSGRILNWLGIDRILVLTLTSYFLRFCTYATMRNPVSTM